MPSSAAVERATISELPPGANGTTKRIGLVGQASAARAIVGSPLASAARRGDAKRGAAVERVRASWPGDRFGDVVVVGLARDLGGRQAAVVAQVALRAALEQQLHGVALALARRPT